MGTYISLTIKNSKGHNRNIFTQKGGLGTAILCFNESSFHYKKDEYYYYEIEPVEAIKNLEKIVTEINEQRYDRYDDWTEKTLTKASTTCMDLINTIMQCEDGEMVYADYSEYLPLLEENYNSNDIINAKRFIERLLAGSYNGYYLNSQENDTLDIIIENFKQSLCQEESIEKISNFGTPYEPKLIKMGDNKLIKFEMDITLKEEYLEKYHNFENLYHKIYQLLNVLGIGMVQNFKSEVKNGFCATFYMLQQ